MQSIFCSHFRAIVIEESEDTDSLPDPNPEQQQPQADNEAPAGMTTDTSGASDDPLPPAVLATLQEM